MHHTMSPKEIADRGGVPQEFLSEQTQPTGAPSVKPSRSTADLDTGNLLGKVLILDRLGQGTAGVVYRALHQSLGIPVAVKVIKATDLCQFGDQKEELKREAQLLARLNHPNVVRVWDFEDHPQYPYLILEIIEGLSLAELIEQSGRLRLNRAVGLVLQVAEGLAAAHALGIIHRDVKPANVLLGKDGMAKVVDFGLAFLTSKQLFAADDGQSAVSPAIVGTPAYMAPEQFLAPSTVDHRSDIYSLGATFYHALTGRLLFLARSRQEVFSKHAQAAFIPARDLVPGLPPAVDSILSKMLAKDQAGRFQTYSELIAALTELNTVSLTVGELINLLPVNQHKGQPSAWPDKPVANASGNGATPGATGAADVATVQQARKPEGSRLTRVDAMRFLKEGIAAAKNGDKQTARILLRRATELDPQSETGWMWLAGLVETSQEAIACFERILEISPQNEEARRGLKEARFQSRMAAVPHNLETKPQTSWAEMLLEPVAEQNAVAVVSRIPESDPRTRLNTCLKIAVLSLALLAPVSVLVYVLMRRSVSLGPIDLLIGAAFGLLLILVGKVLTQSGAVADLPRRLENPKQAPIPSKGPDEPSWRSLE